MEKTLILYVENDPGSCKVMRILVTTLTPPAELIIFEDSHDFMARIHQLERIPDVIFLDIHVMPLNGFDMLKLLRTDEKYADCTVIALTASVMNSEVHLLKEAGFNGILAKPLDFHTFPSQVQKILNGEPLWIVSR